MFRGIHTGGTAWLRNFSRELSVQVQLGVASHLVRASRKEVSKLD